MSGRKVTKNRGSFPNNEAVFKMLYLELKNASKKWAMPIQNCLSAKVARRRGRQDDLQ